MREVSFLAVRSVIKNGIGRSMRGQRVPPTLEAAMPVLAVTEMASRCWENFLRKAATIARSNNDFPVP